jgi:hypothetical protein
MEINPSPCKNLNGKKNIHAITTPAALRHATASPDLAILQSHTTAKAKHTLCQATTANKKRVKTDAARAPCPISRAPLG